MTSREQLIWAAIYAIELRVACHELLAHDREIARKNEDPDNPYVAVQVLDNLDRTRGTRSATLAANRARACVIDIRTAAKNGQHGNAAEEFLDNPTLRLEHPFR